MSLVHKQRVEGDKVSTRGVSESYVYLYMIWTWEIHLRSCCWACAKMTTYNPTSTTVPSESSAWNGFSTIVPVALVDGAGAPLQHFHYDQEEQPGLIDGVDPIPDELLTDVVPRHGENTCSSIYAMALLILFKFAGWMPKSVVDFASTVFMSVGYATHTVQFYVRSQLQYFDDSIFAIGGNLTIADNKAVAVAALTAIKNGINAGTLVVSTATTLPTLSTGLFYIRPSSGMLTIGGGTGVLGGGAETVLFIDGHTTLGSIAATGTFNTTIICTGNVTFNTPAWWSAVSGKLTILAKGAVSASAGAPSTISGSAGKLMVAHGGNYTYYIGGGGTFDGPNFVSFVETATPGVTTKLGITPSNGTPYNAGEIAAISGHDELATDIGMTANHTFYNAGTYTNGFNGTVVYADMVNTQEDEDFAVSFLAGRARTQYAAGMAVTNISKANDVHEIQFSLRGKMYETKVAFQKATNHSPNFGIHTEPHGHQHYIADMLQTYRISNERYEAFKSGRYFEMTQGGWIAVSGADFTLPPISHYNGTMLVDKACTVSTSTAFPTVMPANAGGVDPYVAEGSTFVSKYRRIEASPVVPVEDLTHKTVVIHAPYQSAVKYAPLGGSTDDASGITTIRNDDRRVRVIHQDVVCTRSKDAAATMGVRVNVAQGHFNGVQLSHVTETFALFTFKSELHRVNLNEPIIRDRGLPTEVLVSLRYNSTTSVATFTSVVNGIENTSNITLVAPTEDPTIVHLVVHFGDMIDSLINHVDAAVEEDEHFIRTINGVEHHAKQVVASPNEAGELFLPDLNAEQKNELLEHGVEEITEKLNYYKRFALREIALIRARYAIQAERKVFYSEGQTSVPISLADGDYKNEADVTVVVADGHILVSALPLVKTHVRYVAVLDEGSAHQAVHRVNGLAEYLALVLLKNLDKKSVRSVKPTVAGQEVIHRKHVGDNLVSNLVSTGEIIFEEENGGSVKVVVESI